MPEPVLFNDLPELAQHLRVELENKKFVLLYAYNGTGKTRLSTEFKDIGKDEDEGERDTLYFNAFTEDLFTWDNDLDNDSERTLKLNADSKFFAGLAELEMDNRIRPLLNRYADFDFRIDTDEWKVSFSREVMTGEGEDARTETIDGIKVSRGEENVFIWCFFLAIVQLALDDDGDGPYNWVKYIYIDDPVSSLDEHNAIVIANHLVQIFREAPRQIETAISTHHTLFFNVVHYELKNHFRGKSKQSVLSRDKHSGEYFLTQQQGDTPSFHHVAALVELYKASQSETIHTYHFNMLRVILEKTALFHGYGHFGSCLKEDASDSDGILHQRFVDLLSHGKYSMFEPVEMGNDTKEYFRTILNKFIQDFPYNPALFPEAEEATNS
ncbi:AAA family ATPase [uncultured Pseudodesulfovibrio sp.]|uniref:AAA family ATPase n=1 Tax=uncultured Pseudodesulfovibrio sp. TaxID=2035858 RepID=UPI0029C8ABB5|nr:AAA family ATPase [uncultured Pseudodesulfovibrio sp.]